MLYAGTDSVNKEYVAGTVHANKKYIAGTVPANNKYDAGTVHANKKYTAGTPTKFKFKKNIFDFRFFLSIVRRASTQRRKTAP